MNSVNTLKYQDKIRKHDERKRFRQVQYNLRIQKTVLFLNGITEPLCIGLAGTSVLGVSDHNTEALRLLQDPVFLELSRSNVFGNALRTLGFAIVQLFKMFLDGANAVLNSVYQMFNFYNSESINSYINSLLGLLWIPCLISILTLGFMMILNSRNRPDWNKIVQNGLIIVILVTGLPALLSTASSITQQFVGGNTGTNESNQVIASCLTDYVYMYDWTNQKFDTSKKQNVYVANENFSYVNSIDINETIRYDTGNDYYKSYGGDSSKWDSTDKACMLCTIVTTTGSGYQCEHLNPPEWWEFFSDGYYYRYNFDYVTCLITLGAMTIAIIFTAIKVARILWELAIYRVLAMFFSMADLANGERIKEIIKAFAGAFITIIVTSVLLKFYMIFSAWISSVDGIDAFSKSVILIAVSVAVIDGPNLMQKLIGVDVGIRSAAGTIGSIYAAGKMAHDVGKGAVKVGQEVGEFGKDVASKGAMIGGFAAGAGVTAAGNIRAKHNQPKDERQSEKTARKHEKQQTKANEEAVTRVEDMNTSINRQVAKDSSRKMQQAGKNGTTYSSDSIDTYKEAASVLNEGNTDEEITDMAQDAYLHSHGKQIVSEAAQMQDEAAADSKELSEKDALTSSFASKHKDSSSVSADGTYKSAAQGVKKKIDNLQQSQKQQGHTVQSAKLDNYRKIAQNAQPFKTSEQFKKEPEVQAYIASAAQSHGRNPYSAKNVDVYQGNMSAALEHKEEIMSAAQDYIDEQKQTGNNKITEEQAIAHVVSNEADYDMSYGFDKNYSADIAETIIASKDYHPQSDAVQGSSQTVEQRSERSRSITGNSSLNQSLGREKQRHDRPKSSVIEAAKHGYSVGRNLGRKNKKK